MVKWSRLPVRIIVSSSSGIAWFLHNFSRIYGYSTVSTNDAAFIIGGYDRNKYDNIVEYRNNEWRKLGSLGKGRSYHGAITIGQETLIIGRYSSDGS